MGEIAQIYENLRIFLSEIIITLRIKKSSIEEGEDNEGNIGYSVEETIEVLFNGRLFPLFAEELEIILSTTEGILMGTPEYNNTENKSRIEQIIAQLINKIESREPFIIQSNEDDVKKLSYKVNDRYISRIITSLNNHQHKLWKTHSSSYVELNESEIKNNPLLWCKHDVDLLELVTALYENGAISNKQNDLSRAKALEIFSKFFSINIKDAESKLSKATDRSRDVSPFLTRLKKSFDNYVDRKNK